MDCNILISLLLERKPLKLVAKLGFWLQDWINDKSRPSLDFSEKWMSSAEPDPVLYNFIEQEKNIIFFMMTKTH